MGTIIDLNIHQAGLLFEATELHLLWFTKKFATPPLFEVLLELNHNKLKYEMHLIKIKTGFPHTIDDVTIYLNKLKQSYIMLIDFF